MERKFEEIDRLRLLEMNERDRRIKAEFANLTQALNVLQQEQTALMGQRRDLSERLKEQYKLTSEDTVDLKTGTITRKTQGVPTNVPQLAAVPVPPEELEKGA